MESKRPLNVFVSVSARDTKYRDELCVHLAPLVQRGSTRLWHAGEILVGENSTVVAEAELRRADVVLVLLSKDYLAGIAVETPLGRIEQEKRSRPSLRVIPVPLSPCLWKDDPFFKEHAALPAGGEPISKRDHDEAWFQVATAIAELDTGRGSVAAPLDPSGVSLRYLRVGGPYLFGRDEELAKLDAAWESRGRVRVVSVVAMGGCGKSTLVMHWLNKLAQDDYRGARRVFGYSFYRQGTSDVVADATSFFTAAFRFFGMSESEMPPPAEYSEHLIAQCRRERTLLILDGLEPLQDRAGWIRDQALSIVVRELSAHNSGLVVLTSRVEVKELAAEEGSTARVVRLERLPDQGGIDLLRKLKVIGDDAELRDAVSDFKGHALALSLLGSLLARGYRGDIRCYKQIPGLMDDDGHAGGHAYRAMAAYDGWLGARERAILRLLGLFDRPAPWGALAALRTEPEVPGLNDGLVGLSDVAWRNAVADLRAAGLVEKEDPEDPDSVDAHPLVREYAGSALKQASEAAWKEGNHRLYVWYSGATKELPETVKQMEPLYAAVMHGCQAGMHREAYDDVFRKRIRRFNERYSVNKLGMWGANLSALAGFFEEQWIRPVAALLETGHSFVLNDAGLALRALGRLPEAVAPLRAGLSAEIAREDRAEASVQASDLSELHLMLGQLNEAIETARQSVELANRSGSAFQRLHSLTTLAEALHQAGRPDEALGLFIEAERIQGKLQPEFPLLNGLRGFRFCDLLLSRNEAEEVRRRAEQTLQGGRELNSMLSMALGYISLARAHLVLHPDDPQFQTGFDAAVIHLRASGQQDYLPLGLIHRAAFYRQTDNLSAAADNLDEALRIATRGHMRLYEADARLERVRLFLAQGSRDEAHRELEVAKGMIEEMRYGRRQADLDDLLKRCQEPVQMTSPTEPPSSLSSAPAHSNSSLPDLIRAASTETRCDVAIQTVIGAELNAILDVLGTTPDASIPIDGDNFWQVQFRSERSRRSISVVVHCQGEAGNAASSAAAMKLLERFKPRLMLLVGIAAGRKHKVKIGDVAVPRTVADLTQKVALPDGLAGRPSIPALPHVVMQMLRAFDARKSGWHKQFRARFGDPIKAPPGKEAEYAEHVAKAPALHEVAIASDDVLLRDPSVLEKHAAQLHQQIQIGEMEAAGFITACQSRGQPKPWLVVRGVSDFGDTFKNDDFHRLASVASATFAEAFLRQGLDMRLLEGDQPASVTPPPASPMIPPRNAGIAAAVVLLLLALALVVNKMWVQTSAPAHSPDMARAGPVDLETGAAAANVPRPPGEPFNPRSNVSLRHLPVVAVQLIGRDSELKQLDNAWASKGKIRIVPIVALGGLGKTTLVVNWLKRLGRNGFPGAHRVFAWSFFSQGARDERASSADSFFAEALAFFGDPHPTHINAFEAADHLREILRQERSILVIDGLEPLQYPPGPQEGELKDRALSGLLQDLAIQSRGLVLITSREKVKDLETYEGDAVREIALKRHSKEAGIQILRGLGVSGTDGELGEAVEGVEGHALALTLLGNLLVEQYGGDVRRRKEIPSLFGADAKGDRAMRAMAAYDQWLTGPERALLRLLGLFDRPAPAAALEALRQPAFPGLNDELATLPEPAWNQMLARLRKVSLLAPPAPDGPARLDAHPLVREYFGAKLKEENEAAWKEGHRRLYQWYAAQAPYQPDTIGEMEPLYAAVMHGCRAGMYEDALASVFVMRIQRLNEHYSMGKLGAYGANLSALASFFEEQWTRPVTTLSGGARSFLLNATGFALSALGRLPEAAVPMQTALQISIAHKNWKNGAIDASNLSELQCSIGQLAEAIETARLSVNLADQSGDTSMRLLSRATLADALHQASQLDEAARFFLEAEGMQKEDQPAFPLLYSLSGYRYCDLLLSRGETEVVLRRAEQTLLWAEKDRREALSTALDHLSLARAHLALHPNAPETRTHFNEAVDRLREAGKQDHLPHGLIHRAAFHRQLHDFAAATRDLDEALRLTTRGHMRLHEADARLERTRLLLVQKKSKEARAELTRARKMIEEMGYNRRKPEVAELARQLGLSE